MLSPDQLERFNVKIKDFGNKALQGMKSAVPVDSGELRSGLGVKFKQEFGLITRITFTFPRHGVMVEKGVGRGVKITGVDQSERTPTLWYMPSLEAKLSDLEKIIDDYYEKEMDVAINVNQR